MAQETIIWTGKSGTKYTFTFYSKSTTFNEIEGNYIFAKQTKNGWVAIYIGEGDLKTRTQDKEHLECAEKKGFTRYHVHINKNRISRENEETDLIEGNPKCLIENGGCNKIQEG
jgi:hypothetical protein